LVGLVGLASGRSALGTGAGSGVGWIATLVTGGFDASAATTTFFLTTVFLVLGLGLFAASGPRSNSGVSAFFAAFFRGARVAFLTVLVVWERVRVAFGLSGVAPAPSAPVDGDKSLSMLGENS